MFETLERIMLTPSDRLTITCEACGHAAILSRRAAFTFFGPDASPFTVRRRSRCRLCGERERLVADVV
jgi:hypothetical protein